MPLTPRPEVLDVYWRFAAERQEIFFKRLSGAPGPWTADPILTAHKFCNSYRASDRVSQYLIRNVIFPESRNYPEEDTAFRILFFKLFNTVGTWRFMEGRLGDITLKSFNFKHYDTLLTEANRSAPIYTAAYITCATQAFGHPRKHQNHLALLERMFRHDALPTRLQRATTFAEVFALLRGYPLIGDFMAYQLATDLNYSPVLNFPETSFTAPGPGALRGIKKCFSSLGFHTPESIIRHMQESQEEAFQERGITFKSLFGRPLQLIDCQGLFCETDKYTRVSHPHLQSARSRIKQAFTQHPEPLRVFYPPKWGLNKHLPPLQGST